MARASIPTVIPIDRAAHYLGINPYHFNSIGADIAPVSVSCDDVWFQYDWQNAGKVSRENLAAALEAAEEFTYTYLGWCALPRWVEDEETQLPEYYKTEIYDNQRNSLGRSKSVESAWGYVIEPGVRTKTLIDTPTIVYSDGTGDGYNETATITFATTVTNEYELLVYFPSKSGADEWEIKPLTSVSISGGVGTITFPRYLVPLPVLWDDSPTLDDPHIIIDGDDITNFLTTVDVYRVYNDPSQHMTFYAHPSSCDSSDPSVQRTEAGCLYVKQNRLGLLAYQRADWDAATEAYVSKSFTYMPYKATINYKAGFMDNKLSMPTRQMRYDLEKLIVFYALANIDTELCGCSNTRNIWQKQSEDLSLTEGGRGHVLPWDQFGNPFGTTRAAFALWKFAKRIKESKSPYPN